MLYRLHIQFSFLGLRQLVERRALGPQFSELSFKRRSMPLTEECVSLSIVHITDAGDIPVDNLALQEALQ